MRPTTYSKSRPVSAFLHVKLALSGDIQLNPRPIKHPCKVCKRPVAKNHIALACDNCDFWQHIKCLGVTPNEYEALKQSHCVWICSTCDDHNCGPQIASDGTDSPSPGITSPQPENPFSVFSDSLFEAVLSDLDTSMESQPDPDGAEPAERLTGKLKIMTINCRSLKSMRKWVQFHAVLESDNPDIILGTESHLDKTHSNPETFPPSYTALKRDRDARGSGVFIAHKNDLTMVEVDYVGANCELKAAKFLSRNHPTLLLAAYYRPPSGMVDELDHLHKDLDRPEAPFLIASDFNVLSINWMDGSFPSTPQYGHGLNEKILDIVNHQYLTQTVEEPTCGKNILDLMFTTSPDLMDRWSMSNLYQASVTTNLSLALTTAKWRPIESLDVRSSNLVKQMRSHSKLAWQLSEKNSGANQVTTVLRKIGPPLKKAWTPYLISMYQRRL